ncbi:hypothetical protein LOAG_03343, partial [Loa loa]
MSSWLTFFRLRKIDEKEGNSAEELGTTPLNPSILQELDEEQQAHIREVFRRAEQSQKEARIVLNTKKLSRLSDARFRGTVDENEEFFTVRNESFVQMDSLPENSFSEHSGNFTQSIKRLSRQLYRWMSSLDDDGGDILKSAQKLVRFSTPLSIETDTDFAKYVSKMSHEICTMAIADSVCKIVLDQYCHWLCTVIFTAVYNELKLKYGTDAEIGRYCSELTIDIFKSVYMNAVELLCGQEQLHATWSRSDQNMQTALLRVSSTTFKKSVSCQCIQSLAHLIDQESTLYRHSEFDDDCGEEFCYVLLEEDKEKLSQELTSVLQNFAEELWIHILALVLADLMLKKQGSTLQEQFPGINLISSVEENIQERKRNSFSSIDDYSNLDENSCSMSSDEFVNEYTLLNNEKQSLYLYTKQQVHGKISPPLTLYEMDLTRDIYLNPSFIGACETRKQSRPVSRSSSDSEFSETEWNTEQQTDSESYYNESFYVGKTTSAAVEQLNNDEETRNTEVIKYIERIIKEVECVVSDEATLKTIPNEKVSGQERNMYNPEFDLTTNLEGWSSSTLNTMIHHATSIFDSKAKLEHYMETNMVCSDLKSSSDSQEMKQNGRKNVLIEKEQNSSHSESLLDLTTKNTSNYNELEEDNMYDVISFPYQIHKVRNEQMPSDSCFSSTDEGRASNVSRLMLEMELRNCREESVWRFNDFKAEKFENCHKFDELHNTEVATTQVAIDKKLIYEDNRDLFNNDLDERYLISRKQQSDSISNLKFDETNSTASDILDEIYSDYDMVKKRERNKEEQSFTVKGREWSESANEEADKKFQIQEMNIIRKFETYGTKSDELATAEITRSEDQKTDDLRQIKVKNEGLALRHSINGTKQEGIKYNDLKVEREEWKVEGDETYQNGGSCLIGEERNSKGSSPGVLEPFTVSNTDDIYQTLRSKKAGVKKLEVLEVSIEDERKDVRNVIRTAEGTKQAKAPIQSSPENRDSIEESELFKSSSEKRSKKDPATLESDEASLLGNSFEKVLDEKLESNIEATEINKSINKRSRLTAEIKAKSETDGLVFELHLDRNLDQKNLGTEIQGTEIGIRPTYHATSASDVALSATSGPYSPQESVDVQMNPIQNILPSDAIDESVMVEKENEENVLNDDMEHLVDAISSKDTTIDRISFDDTISIGVLKTTENLLPVHQTTGYDQSLTQEEMRHVTSVTSIAEKEINVQKAAFSKEFEFELTQDELKHIARVSCMAEEAFGKRQTIQRSEELIEEEGVKSDYEEYDVEEKESEKFSEHSQSKASSATSGPDSPQESVDVQMNPIQNILPSDAIDESVMVEKENEENVLNDDMEHLVDAIS